MTLDDAMEKFHKEWGHERKPPIFAVVNKLKGGDFTSHDLYELVWHLHERWEKLGNQGARWGAATSEIRCIMARRRERVAETMKRTDKATAEKLIARLNSV